jgi:hypothetical protein
MNRGERRVVLALVILAGLVMCASTASAGILDGWPGMNPNTPDWWFHPEQEPSYLRAGWWNWNTDWIPGQGRAPNGWETNFEMHPDYREMPWQWSHEGLLEDQVIPGSGIRIPWLEDQPWTWEVDLDTGNAQLYPWKKWYVEVRFRDADQLRNDPNYEHNLAVLREGGMQVDWYARKEVPDPTTGEPIWITMGEGDPGVTEIQSGWGEGYWYDVWYGEYYFEPQPDMEHIHWVFDTTDFIPGSELYMQRVMVGTTCSPEPVTMALLALGLPVGLLARRRRKAE